MFSFRSFRIPADLFIKSHKISGLFFSPYTNSHHHITPVFVISWPLSLKTLKASIIHPALYFNNFLLCILTAITF